ncbi:hypothetical protein A9X01_28475 [Mycobacterium asiaticum]|uniref:Uncharacterized protein n=1 Tax=Mycobacterium asiaticum TaxID=1790 RepID=A0A1A3BR29_MYCAS|nr:hypothetical protein A9X01_28475 [Mycobacterium asiaticum]
MRSGGLILGAAAALVLTCSACGSDKTGSSSTLVTPTTQIAGAGVLGNDRKPEESCGREPAAPGAAVNTVGAIAARCG